MSTKPGELHPRETGRLTLKVQNSYPDTTNPRSSSAPRLIAQGFPHLARVLILHGEASAQVLRDILVQQLMRNDPVHHVAGGRYVELRNSFCVSLMIPASGITTRKKAVLALCVKIAAEMLMRFLM